MSDATSRNIDPHQHELQVREAILAYVNAHPHAADSIKGIAAWWLRNLPEQPSRSELAAELDKLTLAGDLKRTETPDGGAFYSGNASRRADERG
jgi:hypothetical protein